MRFLARLVLVMSLAAQVSAQSAPWWDDYPRIVQTESLSVTQYHHGNIGFHGAQRDPGWSIYGQKVTRIPYKIAQFEYVGIKSIGYFETFGQGLCFIAELGTKGGADYTPMLHSFWNWQEYGGGTIGWIGLHNFFDDESFAQPYTRTHWRYGSPAMTYPDGTVAAGYQGSASDPRNSRIYDAGGSKNIFGDLTLDYGYNATVNQIDPGTGQPQGPLDGLLYIPETGQYAGSINFSKDSACPHWNDFTYASTLMAADEGLHGMWTDNYSAWDSFGNPPVKVGFGDWSVARFRDHLAARFTAGELAAMGVADVSTFDVRSWMMNKATGWGWNGVDLDSIVWRDSRWLDEPLWRAYLIFKRQAGAEALTGYYQAVKSAAAAAGNDAFLVAGNDIPVFSMGWVRGDLDMVSTEVNASWNLCSGPRGFMIAPIGRMAPFYKLAREHAQSRFVNVWFYTDGYETELSQTGVSSTMHYEMLAAHTLPMFYPSAEHPVAGNDPANAAFFGFVEQVAPVYDRRVPVEEVGVYYSSSSVVSRFTPGGYLDHANQPHQFAHWGWSTALGNLQYQYRPIPEWKLTTETLSGLRVLVIPESVVFTASDVADVLTPWVQAGGRLIVTGTSGRRLGEPGNFEPNPGGYTLASLTGVSDIITAPYQQTRTVGAGKVHYIRANIGQAYFDASTSRPGLLPDFAAAMNAVWPAGENRRLAPGPGVDSHVGLTVYEDAPAQRLFIDVSNYNVDATTDVVTDTAALVFTVAAPSWLDGCSVTATVLSPDVPAPAVSVDSATPGEFEITLGSVHYYACVLLEPLPRSDADGDGVIDACDQCPATPPGLPIDGNGCQLFAPCDFDLDADVDQTDFAHMQTCLTEGLTPPTGECGNADMDGDNHVDAYDVAVFTGCVSGPDVVADPYCADMD